MLKPKLWKRVHPRRKSSFWYDGQVATVESLDKVISIEATGCKELIFKQGGKVYGGDSSVRRAKRLGWYDKQIRKIEMNCSNWFTLVDLSDLENPKDMEQVIESFDEALTQAKKLLNKNANDKAA